VSAFEPSRGQRRVWQRNQDLRVVSTVDAGDDEAFDLYRRYINQRHSDGDMYPPEREQFESFLNSVWECTRYFRFYDTERLVAVAVADSLDDGLSAIYTFFDPSMVKRSLGVYAILWEIDQARELDLDYVYLGYWIQNCQKMAYKSNYRPLQVYLNNSWSNLS